MSNWHDRIISKRQTIKVSLSILFMLPVFIYAQQKYALFVGISNYPQYKQQNASFTQIHGTNDIALISPLLRKQGFKVSKLADKAATLKAIEKELEKLTKNVHSGDIVYIHFSGHGQAFEDLDGDEEDGWDEAFIPYDAERVYQEEGYHGEHHLLDDVLNTYLNSIREKLGEKGMVYVVIDACHSGSSYRGEEQDSTFVRGTDVGFSKSGKNYAPKIDNRGNFHFTSKRGMAPIYMLEACRSYQVNTEIMQNGIFYGPISYYISRQLLTSELSFDIKWIDDVRKNMDKDTRLVRQNMVIESSK